MITRLICALAVTVAAAGAQAADILRPDGARALVQRLSPLDSYHLPIAPFDGADVPTRRVEGRVDRRTWQIDDASLTTLQVLTPLRDQLVANGHDILFECEDSTCGGFDFRFGIEVVPAPNMYVDIRNYRFLAAVDDDGRAVSLLVSRSRSAVYAQIVGVEPADLAPAAQPTEPAPQPTGDLADRLLRDGHVILRDLDFETNADTLGAGPHESLRVLAAFLQANPAYRIALVGHTDSVGGLEPNIDLSRRRARAVRTRLIERHNADPARIEAEGMGYLAPVASNLSPAGQNANRRVEAILVSGG